MRKKILLIAGERSGDTLGSDLLDQLDRDLFDISIVGGPSMEKKSGRRSLFPMEELAVMGIFELLPRLPRILRRIGETARFAVNTAQDLVLTIDSPDFCFRVMKKIRQLDRANRIKGFHLVAPSVWFYRGGRAKKIARLYDELFCLLPFEPPYFEKYGLRTIFVGHPILGRGFAQPSASARDSAGPGDSRTIVLTPGSRTTEIRAMLPLMLAVARDLRKTYNLNFSILTSEDMEAEVRKYLGAGKIGQPEVISDPQRKLETLARSSLAIAKSGTNTLEIAARSVPLVVIYRFNFLTNILVGLFLRMKSGPKFANIVNILAAREIVPEFIVSKCRVKNIVEAAIHLLESGEARARQLEDSRRILEQLSLGAGRPASQLMADEIRRSLAL
ncbi:MAG: lipid-A-disaccharide synthase [Rickettsiales bacterium]|jgi:lipid-A-disaccharide synthase|nr:lipid-A-disaccharide synthase [Rickettsiales bacterium]